jgi:DNA polymerase I-like protein with 3'-5' exonuclease and polymerase domains
MSANEDVVGDVVREVDASGIRPEARSGAIDRLCEQRGLSMYDSYHALLPELKQTSREAGAVAKKRGYAKNIYGRRRHLPANKSWLAFNSVCQSGAGDMMKERMVALDELVPEFRQVLAVHDSTVGLVELDVLKRDDSVLRRIVDVMSDPERPLKVPVRADIGWSERSWGEADSDERRIKFGLNSAQGGGGPQA